MGLMTLRDFDAKNAGADTMPRAGSFYMYLCTRIKLLCREVCL